MRAAIVLLVVFVACQAVFLNLKHDCKTNNDCPNTHCCVTDFHGDTCFHYQNESQPCHLTGHAMHLYKCGCSTGYTCQGLHIDPGHTLPDPDGSIHHAEELLGQIGYGLCVKTSS
ncbi:uncharacterized protein LOC134713684 [Mytilus trossulus]|uniref:uncharacterized protein LOC134713684 n=1 Tax=Mytilus trossulus TaxID=6551 RepID=UPI003003AAB3